MAIFNIFLYKAASPRCSLIVVDRDMMITVTLRKEILSVMLREHYNTKREFCQETCVNMWGLLVFSRFFLTDPSVRVIIFVDMYSPDLSLMCHRFVAVFLL